MRFALPCIVLLITAGCTSPSGGPSDGTPVSPVSTSETATSTCEPGTAELELALPYNRTVRVTVHELGTEEVVHDQTYSGETRPAVTFDGRNGVFEPATDYQVRVRMDGSVEWNRTVRRNEWWRIRAYANGTVSRTRPVAVYDTDC